MDPAAGKFAVQRDGDTETIATVNNARYSAFVALADSLDTARMAALYKQNYPLFQSAYKELGYPNAYFNDRLVAVKNRYDPTNFFHLNQNIKPTV